jgi:chemotaxis protein MotB
MTGLHPSPPWSPTPPAHPLLAPTPRAGARQPASVAWLITFTDLVALMLTFFVLLFAMSQLDQQKWQSLVESLTSHLNSVEKSDSTKLAADYQVEVPIAPPAADLDYLEPILREHLAADPALADRELHRVATGLSLSFSELLLFAGGTARLTPQGGKAVFALGGVLRNLHNAVDVEVHGGPSAPTVADWQTALARAAAVTRLLAESGYAGPILARSLPDDGGATRIDVVIREDQRERP